MKLELTALPLTKILLDTPLSLRDFAVKFETAIIALVFFKRESVM